MARNPGAEWRKTSTEATKIATRGVDRAIAALASKQHGVVSLRQLTELGLAASSVRMRALAGRLHPLYPGVYAVGHRVLTWKGRLMAALLACGEGAFISHMSAASLWDLVAPSIGAADVSCGTRAGRGVTGVRAHNARGTEQPDLTMIDGIACTSLPRTLIDVAAITPDAERLARICERADAHRVFDLGAANDAIRRHRGRRGVARLRAVVQRMTSEPALTKNDFEDLILSVCERANLPRPLVNQWLDIPGGPYEADLLWPKGMVIAEADGRATHGTIAAFERDRVRDQNLAKAGYQVLRFPYRQVVERPEEVANAIRTVLRRRSFRRVASSVN